MLLRNYVSATDAYRKSDSHTPLYFSSHRLLRLLTTEKARTVGQQCDQAKPGTSWSAKQALRDRTMMSNPLISILKFCQNASDCE